jgi:TonB-dependent starch-binding outer membrane protein SusC
MNVNYFLRKVVMLLVIVAAFSNFAIAQRTISGSVTDAKSGEALIGATVQAKGTAGGTVTDVDGKFSISVAKGTTTLVISYTGYASQEAALGTSNTVDVKLEGGSDLGVVVVNAGYGTQKQSEVTTAITSVKKEDFNVGNVSNVTDLLQGKVAGLSIAQPGGDPNGKPTVRLRGLSTIGSSKSPLYVIDGIPGLDETVINGADVEQVDVLKDASAGAIYGASASAGVIIITTRKGKDGEPAVSFNSSYTQTSIDRTPAILSAAEFKAAYPTNDKGSAINWYDQITRTGATTRNSLSFSGGSKSLSYRASMNYRDQQGVAIKDGNAQYDGSFGLSQKALNDRLTLTIGGFLGTLNQEIAPDAFRYATVSNPTAASFLDATSSTSKKYGGYYQSEGFDIYNPRAMIDQSTIQARYKQTTLYGKAEFQLTDDIKIGSTYSQNRQSLIAGEYYSRFGYYRGTNANGLASRFTGDDNNDYFNVQAGYLKQFGKINFGIIAGYDNRLQVSEGFRAQTAGFTTDQLGYDFLQGATNLATINSNLQVASGREESKLIAFYSRATVNFDDTYVLNLTVRPEGSSRLAEGKKWATFHAESFAVNLTKLAPSLKNTFDQLKLRVGYGVTGNPPLYAKLSQGNYAPQSNGGISLLRNGNPDLGWEYKSSIDVGLDFKLMKGRMNINLDYYSQKSKDCLFYFPNTAAGLFEKQGLWANGGQISGQGLELSLDYKVIDRKGSQGFEWKTGLILATNKSFIDSIHTDKLQLAANGAFPTANPGAPGLNNDYYVLVQEGQPVGQIWTYEFAGTNAAGQPLGFAADGTKKLLPDLKDSDKKVFGTGLPSLTAGWSNSFKYDKFEFGFTFRGAFGHYLINENRVFYERNLATAYNSIRTKYYDPNVKAASWNSLYVEKADFVKLENVSLSYNFDFAKGSAFKSVRATISARNLLTFTGYTGIDPEVRYADTGNSDNGNRQSNIDNPDPLAPGIDRRTTYYTTKSFTFGLSFGF